MVLCHIFGLNEFKFRAPEKNIHRANHKHPLKFMDLFGSLNSEGGRSACNSVSAAHYLYYSIYTDTTTRHNIIANRMCANVEDSNRGADLSTQSSVIYTQTANKTTSKYPLVAWAGCLHLCVEVVCLRMRIGRNNIEWPSVSQWCRRTVKGHHSHSVTQWWGSIVGSWKLAVGTLANYCSWTTATT